MISSQGTQVQRWSKGTAVTLLLLLLALHCCCLVLLLLYCPDMFQSDRFQGAHCEPTSDHSALGCQGCAPADCASKSDGELVTLSSTVMSFRFPRDSDVDAWNWKLTASLSIYLKVYGDDLLLEQEENSTVPLDLDSFEQQVTVSASLDYALNANLEAPEDRGLLKDPEDGALLLSSPWHSKARVRSLNRTLQCRLVPAPDPTTEEETGEELSFLCVLTPLLELFPLSNSSYLVALQVEGLVENGPVNLVDTNATMVSYLTTVSETRLFHQIRFYTKCAFAPVILACLVWFLVRLCVNDLYVNIPDRLVITAAVAQLLSNLPTELVVARLPLPPLLLLDPVASLLAASSLALFWIVFTLDKLADNEPWERTTRLGMDCLIDRLLIDLGGKIK